MDEARRSISQTVDEIKETVVEQVASVRETVSGVLDLREQFQRDPVVWSLGALSAGFALGYTLGYAHKHVKSARGRRSELAAFADDLVGELAKVGEGLVLPSLDAKLKTLLGFDLSAVLRDIAAGSKPAAGKRRTSRPTARRRTARR
jgi:hypothetical protein